MNKTPINTACIYSDECNCNPASHPACYAPHVLTAEDAEYVAKRLLNAGIVPRETVNVTPMHTAHEPRRFAKPLTDDERLELMQLITQALEHVENIAQAAPIMRADIHKRTIKKKDDGFRPYTLKDAKSPARIAALRLRAAWDIVDPPLSKG